VQLRIPIELQAVFLESWRTGTTATPPPVHAANRTFPRRHSSPGWDEDEQMLDIDTKQNCPCRRVSLDSSIGKLPLKVSFRSRWCPASETTDVNPPRRPQTEYSDQDFSVMTESRGEDRWQCQTREDSFVHRPPKMPSCLAVRSRWCPAASETTDVNPPRRPQTEYSNQDFSVMTESRGEDRWQCQTRDSFVHWPPKMPSRAVVAR
jgi:hypothetical protein